MDQGAPPIAIGLSAKLEGERSVHLTTFEHAIEMAIADNPDAAKRVLLHFENDGADAGLAAIAAGKLADKGVACVVGHYASGAARAAVPRYRVAGIPLLLPAATADDLTAGTGPVYRLCSQDSRLACEVVNQLESTHGPYVAECVNDGSPHGAALAAAIVGSAQKGASVVADAHSTACVVIFVGLYRASVEFVRARRASGDRRRIYLTDDALYSGLVDDLAGCCDDLAVFGFAPPEWICEAPAVLDRYQSKWGSPAGTYFIETYAAMEIALNCALCSTGRAQFRELLSTRTWPTVLGPLRLDNAELGQGCYALWESVRGALQPTVRLGAAAAHLNRKVG